MNDDKGDGLPRDIGDTSIEWEMITKGELRRLREEHHELRIVTGTDDSEFRNPKFGPLFIIAWCPAGDWCHFYLSDNNEDDITAAYREHLT